MTKYFQFFLFILGGVLSALLDLTFTWILLYYGIWYVISVSVGFLGSVLFNFMYHATITFDVTISKYTMMKYALILAINYVLMLAIVILFQAMILPSAFIGKCVALPLIALNSYTLGKFWIFTKQETVY